MSFTVRHTPELDRVIALPRRRLTDEGARAAAERLTPEFAARPGLALLARQGASLDEVRRARGGWLALPVGSGKTLISYLLPTLVGARRTLLVMKGNSLAKQKTPHDFRQLGRDGWRKPRAVTIKTLEWLSTAGADTKYDAEGNVERLSFLDEYDPDLIVIDEADDLASTTNAAVMRLDRFVRAKRDRAERAALAAGASEAEAVAARRDVTRGGVVAVLETGTPIRKSLMGIWHLLFWALDTDAPMPASKREAEMWALALDEHDGRRPSPGPLGATVEEAREWFRVRLLETPGVVIFDGDSCDAPLTVRIRIARECDETNAQFERFAVEQENPGGISVTDPLSRSLLDGELGCQRYSYWDPAPPERWATARRVFAAFARQQIEASQRWSRPLYTEGQVISRHKDNPAVREWLAVRGDFDPLANRRTAWFGRATLDSCHDWLRTLDRPGVVFCGQVEFGEALAREARLPYYGQGGLTSDGSSIVHANPRRSFVASWQANKKGLNLQPWPRLLIVTPPQSAKWLEQILGRSHRHGQSERVIVDLLATSGGTLDTFERAIAEARFARGIVSLTQKILRADIVRAEPVVTVANAFRWARRQRPD
jgi:hypothetical protein